MKMLVIKQWYPLYWNLSFKIHSWTLRYMAPLDGIRNKPGGGSGHCIKHRVLHNDPISLLALWPTAVKELFLAFLPGLAGYTQLLHSFQLLQLALPFPNTSLQGLEFPCRIYKRTKQNNLRVLSIIWNSACEQRKKAGSGIYPGIQGNDMAPSPARGTQAEAVQQPYLFCTQPPRFKFLGRLVLQTP